MQTRLALSTLLFGLVCSPVTGAEKITLERLLRQMSDLSLLAEFPDPPYSTKQFSSYDRASETPGHEIWFANHDRGFTLYDGVVKVKTPFFKSGPPQDRVPDGNFDAGTKAGIARNRKPVGNYVWAYATGSDGSAIGGKIPQGYILNCTLRD